MGISALHLLSMNPQDHHTLALASGQYLGKALKEHRAAVGTMDLRNPEELIIAAVLIAHHHWLSASTVSRAVLDRYGHVSLLPRHSSSGDKDCSLAFKF
jgi:hypothetical protein